MVHGVVGMAVLAHVAFRVFDYIFEWGFDSPHVRVRFSHPFAYSTFQGERDAVWSVDYGFVADL